MCTFPCHGNTTRCPSQSWPERTSAGSLSPTLTPAWSPIPEALCSPCWDTLSSNPQIRTHHLTEDLEASLGNKKHSRRYSLDDKMLVFRRYFKEVLEYEESKRLSYSQKPRMYNVLFRRDLYSLTQSFPFIFHPPPHIFKVVTGPRRYSICNL